MFLDYAEDRVSQRKMLTLDDWRANLDRFISFNERPVLKNAGRISHERMKTITHERYEAFDHKRKHDEALAADAEDLKELEAIEAKAVAVKREKK